MRGDGEVGAQPQSTMQRAASSQQPAECPQGLSPMECWVLGKDLLSDLCPFKTSKTSLDFYSIYLASQGEYVARSIGRPATASPVRRTDGDQSLVTSASLQLRPGRADSQGNFLLPGIHSGKSRSGLPLSCTTCQILPSRIS